MKPEGTSSREVLDPDVMQQLLDLDDGELGLLCEMYELFRDDTPPRIALLEAAIQEGDREQMGDTAHAVKGAASTMGAPKVRAYAQLLEACGRAEQSGEDLSGTLAQLKTAFAEALAGLEAFIAERKG